jgi:hypothetical protein
MAPPRRFANYKARVPPRVLSRPSQRLIHSVARSLFPYVPLRDVLGRLFASNAPARTACFSPRARRVNHPLEIPDDDVDPTSILR